MSTKKTKNNKNMFGGDGYAVNVFQPIAGRPSYIRYTDNCKPIFNGSLLQGGGSYYYPPVVDPTIPNPDGTATNALNRIENTSGEIKGFNINKYENFMVLNSSPGYILNGGGPGCGCDGDSKNPLMNWLSEQKQQQSMNGGSKNMKGGFVGTSGLEQFGAIQTLAKMLTPMGVSALASLVVLVFLHHTVKNKLKNKKAKMMGGAAGALESVLIPLGKNNLVVLGAILLLHHYAKKTIQKKKMLSGGSRKNNQQSGGSITGVLNKLLMPLGVNTLGASLLLVAIRQAFVRKMNKNKSLKGGFSDVLTKMVKKVSAKEFQAKGLFKTLESLFDAQMKKNINNNKENDENVKVKFDVLFNDIAPVTFSTFATKKSYKKADELKKFIVKKNQKN